MRKTFMEGVGLRLLAAFLMTVMSASVHAVADTASLGQIMFWRSGVALIVICIYMAARRELRSALITKYPRLHVVRSLLGAFSMAMSFLSLAYLPIANAQALGYLAPILMMPLAAVMLKERIAPIVFLGVCLGFGGVVALLWDALSLPSDGAMIGVAAGLTYAFTVAFVRVHTKRMTQTETASAIAFYFAITATVVGLATFPFGWPTLSTIQFCWLVFAGVSGGIGHIASNEAIARAPVSTLAPFDFTGLIWALGFDVILFSHMPAPIGLLGVFVITLAALLVTFQRSARNE